MTLKSHLIVVAILILLVFCGWQALKISAERNAIEAANRDDSRAIQVVRASWALNCKNISAAANRAVTSTEGKYAFDNQDKKTVTENNILEAVAGACNGLISCPVKNSTEVMGYDPAPDCFDKRMEIEYRCSAFDRLWKLTIPANESGDLNCSIETDDQRQKQNATASSGGQIQ